MDVDACSNGDEPAHSQHLQLSSQLSKESAPSSSTSPSTPSPPLSNVFSSLSSAASSSEELLISADPFEQLDSFLRDALNSKNRITVLRLELEVEKFVRNPKKQQLLLNPMPSSYERLAAHRVAQHYHVQSMALDSGNPSAPWVLLVKTPESRHPSIKLADVPFELNSEAKSVAPPSGKVAIKQRARQGSIGNESTYMGMVTPVKSVEERMEEYNKARARIFSDGDRRTGSNETLALSEATCSAGFPSEGDAGDTDFLIKSANTVAVFRDREKDMKDPDYNRNRFLPSTRSASLGPSVILGLYSTEGLGSSLVAEARYGHLQSQASYPSACDNHGCIWFGAGVSSIVGYPGVFPNALGQNVHPHHSNAYQCNEEFVFPRDYSSVDWRQDPSKSNPCSMLSTHHVGWFQNH